MSVLVERIDSSGLSNGGEVAVDFLTDIPPGAKNFAVLDNFPTGKEPVCAVNCNKNNLEANLYIIKPYLYLPVFKTRDLIQLLVFDNNEDDFEWQRIAKLTPVSNSYKLPVKANGKFSKSWIRFTLV